MKAGHIGQRTRSVIHPSMTGNVRHGRRLGHERQKLGYWAVLLYASTRQHDDKMLANVKENGGNLTEDLARSIARKYKFARTFHGISTQGYESIAATVNEFDTSNTLSFPQRVQGAADLVELFHSIGYSRNPSGVTKMLWFRNPNHWYIYDTQSANAVGAGLSSVQGMRAFFAILVACGVRSLNEHIASLVAEAGFAFRSERIIDKFLWLRGSTMVDKEVAKPKGLEANLFADNGALRDLASAVYKIVPDDRFDLLRYAEY